MHDHKNMDEEQLNRLLAAVRQPQLPAGLAERIVSASMQHEQVRHTSLLLRIFNALDSVGGGYALRPAFCSLLAIAAFTIGMADGYLRLADEEDYSAAWLEETEITGDMGDVGGT